MDSKSDTEKNFHPILKDKGSSNSLTWLSGLKIIAFLFISPSLGLMVSLSFFDFSLSYLVIDGSEGQFHMPSRLDHCIQILSQLLF